ncbi:MAG TPA: hypothetical protein VFP35_03145 [Candidatus Saccharimonadales bacterium]|nr:hypothetical protein [Candidatus Saccharimonadales bacterium]
MNRIPENLSPVVEIDDVLHYRPPMEEVRGLAWNLGSMVSRSSFEIKYLVGVTRGGLSITDCISRAMGIKDIQTLAVEVYEESQEEAGNPEVPSGNIKVYRKPKLPKDGKGALFADDVLDSGLTAGYIRENWPEAAIAVAYTKKPHPQTTKEVDFYGKYVGGVWIDFPWEMEAQVREELRNGNHQIIL